MRTFAWLKQVCMRKERGLESWTEDSSQVRMEAERAALRQMRQL